MRMRAARATALALLTAAAMTGCGGSQGPAAKGEDAKATDGAQRPAAMSLPPAYDGTRGWDETLPWVPGTDPVAPVAVVPGAKAVALLTQDGAGFAVRSRAADSGEVRWGSAIWRPPVLKEGAKEAKEIPDVLAMEQDGRKFVVVSAHGMAGKDDLHDGTEVVRLAVYDAEGRGSGQKPLREIDVPVTADAGDWRVSADGGRLLVGYGEFGRYPQWSSAVDVVTGKVTPYANPAELLPQCAGKTLECGWARVVAAGPNGPLVGLGRGFGVPGGWFGDAVRPEGVNATVSNGLTDEWNGDVYGVAAGRFLAQWHRTDKDGSSEPTAWSVHEVASGRLLARIDCAYDDFPSVTAQGNDRAHPVVSSPSGRFLAAGPVAFDLQRKQGICLQGDGNRKTIAVNTVGDDGVAYGTVGEDSDGPRFARLDLTTATGDAKILPVGVEIPQRADVDGAGSGLFVVRDKDQNIRVSLRPAR
ncbi:hypothetical protein ACIRSU_12965 [Streptomyces sp. NPDC101160]|uniref:hypothetical protein n=1 Tax=Streptomyces sp. NPDC101160 TaxID=3366118 RepID=UPI003812C2C1